MTEKTGQPHNGPGNRQTEQPTNGIARISSTQLLDASGRLLIEHNGQEYMLRVTRSGKLILTK